MKKSFGLIFLALAAALLFGCGNSGDQQTEKTQTEDISVEYTQETTAAPKEETSGEDSYTGWITEDNGYVITGCTPAGSNVRVPDTIDGKTVVAIDEYAFATDERIVSVILPDSVESIGENAFLSAENLESIELGRGLKSVETMAFYNCPKLKTLVFPDGCESIGDCLFMNEQLTEVVIPSSVTELALNIGESCPKMIIITPAGSFAEQFAIENGIPYKNS